MVYGDHFCNFFTFFFFVYSFCCRRCCWIVANVRLIWTFHDLIFRFRWSFWFDSVLWIRSDDLICRFPVKFSCVYFDHIRSITCHHMITCASVYFILLLIYLYHIYIYICVCVCVCVCVCERVFKSSFLFISINCFIFLWIVENNIVGNQPSTMVEVRGIELKRVVSVMEWAYSEQIKATAVKWRTAAPTVAVIYCYNTITACSYRWRQRLSYPVQSPLRI